MNLIVDWVRGMNCIRGLFRLSVLGTLVLISACNSTKFLAEDEELLVSQEVKLLDAKKADNRSGLTYDLTALAQQQLNGDFLWLFPREYFYLSNSKVKDTTWIDRTLRNTFGQPPTIYNDSLSQASVRAMQSYLQYLGYFNAEVYHEADRKKKKVRLSYYARPGARTYINEIQYSSDQPELDSLLKMTAANSLLKKGEPLDLNIFSQEKERIGRFLRNQGYAFLYNNAFDQLEVDTFQQPGLANIYLKILPPSDREAHIRYRIGRVDIYPDFQLRLSEDDTNNSVSVQLDTFISGIHFAYQSGEISVEPQTLLDNIFLQPGEYYSRTNFDKTNQQLGGLGIFRFVRVNQVLDTADQEVIHYVIQLTPNEKMEIGASLDLSYTNRNASVAGNLVGISLSPSFRNRNFLGGAELLVADLRAGVEFNPQVNSSNSGFINTVDAGVDFSLSLPRFRDYLGSYRLLHGKGKGLLTDRFYNAMLDRGETRFGLGFEYLLIRDFYAYTQFNARYGYDLNISATTRYRINHLAADILIPQTEPNWDTILMNNPYLQRSFGEQYFFSFLFRDLNYQRTGRTDRRGRSVNFNVNLEVAGAELYAANQIINLFRENDRAFKPGEAADFAQYFRSNFDIRYYKTYNERNSFASRFFFGVALPFGFAEAVPYVKQFSAGGANSMRAWDPRGLGPGGFVDPLSLLRARDRENRLLFQTGDLQLELNLEYRYKLFWQVKGALFLDIGNVWTLAYQDEDRCGSQFRFRGKTYDCNGTPFQHQPFYRQMAIGAGTGLRIDLSYFIFRLDVSVPVRYNYPSERPPVTNGSSSIPERLYWNDYTDFAQSLGWRLGLGYPF